VIGGQLQSTFSNPVVLIGVAIIAAFIIAGILMKKK